MEPNSIFGYTDYRQYLSDFYQWRKNGPRGYSYRSFAKAAGFSSPNLLKLVIENKRNLTSASQNQFIKALGLKGIPAQYFRTLVAMNQSKVATETAFYFRQLQSLVPHAQKRRLDEPVMEYLSHWVYPVIREMVLLPEFRADPYWIQRRLYLNLPLKVVEKALQFLLKEGFIERDAQDRYVQSDRIIESSDEVGSLAVRSFHQILMEEAARMVDAVPMEKRGYRALTLALSQESSQLLKQKIKAFGADLLLWAESLESPTAKQQVVQVNIQFYPQTKAPDPA